MPPPPGSTQIVAARVFPSKKANRPMVFGKADDQCVWSRAGVIKSMKCINAFDCLGCSLDRKVQASFESKEAPRGAETLRTPRMRMLGGQLKFTLLGHEFSPGLSFGSHPSAALMLHKDRCRIKKDRSDC